VAVRWRSEVEVGIIIGVELEDHVYEEESRRRSWLNHQRPLFLKWRSYADNYTLIFLIFYSNYIFYRKKLSGSFLLRSSSSQICFLHSAQPTAYPTIAKHVAVTAGDFLPKSFTVQFREKIDRCVHSQNGLDIKIKNTRNKQVEHTNHGQTSLCVISCKTSSTPVASSDPIE